VIRRAALLAVALVVSACMGESDDEPVTRYLLFTKAIDQPEQAVWIGDVDGSKMHRLTRGVYGLVSPDGTKIAVSRRAGVFTVNPDGGGEDFIARGRPAEWLPDSRHLLATQGDALVNIDVGDGSVAVIDRRKGGTWRISPDGKSIAYDIYRDPPGPRECWFDIYTARVNGDSKRRLTTGGRSSNPVWGDDWIAFAYRPPGTGCFAPRIWKMRPDGSEKQPIMKELPRRLSSSGYYGVEPFQLGT
jgi:Tol biopolymer transport system component